MTDPLQDLIAELEACEKASRQLSWKVLIAVGWCRIELNNSYALKSPDGEVVNYTRLPSPTEFLEHAINVVPEEFEYRFLETNPVDGWGKKKYAWVGKNEEPPECYNSHVRSPGGDALALCIAALKARQAIENDAE